MCSRNLKGRYFSGLRIWHVLALDRFPEHPIERIVVSGVRYVEVTFTALGATSNSGTVTFTYGTVTKTLSIPNVGDPTLVGDSRKP